MIESIGYKAVPVTIRTIKGPVTGTVGITYGRETDRIWILEYWLNSALSDRLDRVEQDMCKLKANEMFSGSHLPKPQVREWEGVLYG